MIYDDPANQNPVTNESETSSTSSDTAALNTPRSSSAPRGKFNIFTSIQTIVTYAFLLATLFTLFTPDNLFSGQMLTRVFEAWQANPTLVAPISTSIVAQEARRIGIVSGHWKND